MTRQQAYQQNLDVYMFAASNVGLLEEVKAGMVSQDRAVEQFEETIMEFKLLCLAVGPRPDAGKIAKQMKGTKHD